MIKNLFSALVLIFMSSFLNAEINDQEMVTVPAGEFEMGCNHSRFDEICERDAFPTHKVFLDAYQNLKLSASAIRKMRFSDNEAFNLYLGRLLGQPLDNNDKVLEEQLAEDIPIEVVSCDDRYFQVQSVEQSSFNNMLTCWKSQNDKSTRLMSVIASWKSIAEIKEDAACLVGIESGQSQFNHQLPAGRYLTSSFKIKDLSGYYFAWTRIYHYILTEGLEPSLDASVLEIYDSPNKVLARSMVLSVFIHLDS